MFRQCILNDEDGFNCVVKDKSTKPGEASECINCAYHSPNTKSSTILGLIIWAMIMIFGFVMLCCFSYLIITLIKIIS